MFALWYITEEEIEEEQGTEVVILGYPAYCRYRAILLRLETCADKWMKNAIVSAIGGFTVKTDSARVMFCKDTFEHPDLEEHEFRQDWLGEYNISSKLRLSLGLPTRCSSRANYQ